MDKDRVDKEFENLLSYNEIHYTGSQGPEEDGTPCMSLVELSGIVQDLNSMLWFLQEIMTRVYEEKSISIDASIIETLRNIQEESSSVIEGLVFDDDDDDYDEYD